MPEFEDVLYGDAFDDPARGYAAYVDLDAFVDWYLVQELFRNQDSNFYSSVHVTWRPGGRFALGGNTGLATLRVSSMAPTGYYSVPVSE